MALLKERNTAEKLVAAIEADDRESLTESLSDARQLSLCHPSVHRAREHLSLLAKREDVCTQLKGLSADASSRRRSATSSELAAFRDALAAAKDVRLPDCDELKAVRMLVIVC